MNALLPVYPLTLSSLSMFLFRSLSLSIFSHCFSLFLHLSLSLIIYPFSPLKLSNSFFPLLFSLSGVIYNALLWLWYAAVCTEMEESLVRSRWHQLSMRVPSGECLSAQPENMTPGQQPVIYTGQAQSTALLYLWRVYACRCHGHREAIQTRFFFTKFHNSLCSTTLPYPFLPKKS